MQHSATAFYLFLFPLFSLFSPSFRVVCYPSNPEPPPPPPPPPPLPNDVQVELSEVVERLGLGPNGGLVFCIEYMAENMDWLKEVRANFDTASSPFGPFWTRLNPRGPAPFVIFWP